MTALPVLVSLNSKNAYTEAQLGIKPEPETPIDQVVVGPAHQVLWVRGLFDDLYHISEAARAAFPEGRITTKYQRDLPDKVEDLSNYGTIIMPNVPMGRFRPKVRKAYANWTKAGGHLVILGGTLSLGQGGMKESDTISEILPCTLDTADVKKLPEHSMLRVVNAPKAPADTESSQVFYAHVTKPKATALITATVNDIPLLMTHKVNKGRCTVFAGTTLGAKKDHSLAFWNRPLWRGLMRDILQDDRSR